MEGFYRKLRFRRSVELRQCPITAIRLYSDELTLFLEETLPGLSGSSWLRGILVLLHDVLGGVSLSPGDKLFVNLPVNIRPGLSDNTGNGF